MSDDRCTNSRFRRTRSFLFASAFPRKFRFQVDLVILYFKKFSFKQNPIWTKSHMIQILFERNLIKAKCHWRQVPYHQQIVLFIWDFLAIGFCLNGTIGRNAVDDMRLSCYRTELMLDILDIGLCSNETFIEWDFVVVRHFSNWTLLQ